MTTDEGVLSTDCEIQPAENVINIKKIMRIEENNFFLKFVIRSFSLYYFNLFVLLK
jgi:hypothetical protein